MTTQCYEASVVPLSALDAAAMGQVRIISDASARELVLVAKWLAQALKRDVVLPTGAAKLSV